MKKLLIIFSIMMFLPTVSFADSPVHEWLMDENSGSILVDTGSTPVNCTLVNEPTYVTGKYGYGVQLNGTQWADCGNDTSFNFATGDFSAEAWVKLGEVACPLCNGNPIMGFTDSSTTGWDIISWKAPSDVVDLQLYNSTDYDDTYANIDINGDDNWHHIVGVRNDTHILMFVDGVLYNDTWDDGLNSKIDVTISDPFLIGATGEFPSDSMNGTIDNVRLWDRALNETEVSNLYNYDALEEPTTTTTVPTTTTTTTTTIAPSMGPVETTLGDIGSGLGSLFSELGVPTVILIILLAVGATVGVIISGIGKRISI